jgi:uncharacterized SAM-binding protein YcdF (DUF218 family)
MLVAEKHAVVSVFGAKVINGSIKDTNTENRVKTAVIRARLLRKDGYTVWFVPTGGVDHVGQTKSTGVLMAEEIVQLTQGEVPYCILIGDLAMNTWDNIREIRKLLKLQGLWRRFWWQTSKIYVVSEEHHTKRIALSFLLMYWIRVVRVPTDDKLTPEQIRMEKLHYLIHLFDWHGLLFGTLIALMRKIAARK